MTQSMTSWPSQSQDPTHTSAANAVVFGVAGLTYGGAFFLGDTWFHADEISWITVAVPFLLLGSALALTAWFTEHGRRGSPEWLRRSSARVVGLGLGLTIGAVGLPLAAILFVHSKPTTPPLHQIPYHVFIESGLSMEHFLLRGATVVGAVAVFAMTQSKINTQVAHGATLGLLVVVASFRFLGGLWGEFGGLIWGGFGGLILYAVVAALILWNRPMRVSPHPHEGDQRGR